LGEKFLEELQDFLECVDIIPDKDLTVQAFLVPETNQLLINPNQIETLDEFYFVILHEFCHWQFPELTEDEADINASIWLSKEEVRGVLDAEVGEPEWLNSEKL